MAKSDLVTLLTMITARAQKRYGWREVYLFQSDGFELHQGVVFDCVADLNRMATDFAVFHVGLVANRGVEHHGNLFPAVRACEGVLHQEVGCCIFHL